MDKKNDLRLDSEYQGAFSKNQKRQRDERRGGNGGNDAGGKPAATGAYPEETVQMGKNARAFAEEYFNSVNINQRIYDILRDTVEE